MSDDVESLKRRLEEAEEKLRALISPEKETQAACLDAERHFWQQSKRERHAMTGLGEGWDSLCVFSEVKLKTLLDTVLTHRLVLLRAPPGSGKTATAEAFVAYAVSLGHPVYSLNLAYSPEVFKDVDTYFRNYWKREVFKTSFSAILHRANTQKSDEKKLILVLDEVQLWYQDAMLSFWHTLKADHTILVLCFASFGDTSEVKGVGTPLIFKKYLGFPELQLDFATTETVAKNLSVESNHAPFIFTETLQKLHYHTNGHAGMIRIALRSLCVSKESYDTLQKQFNFIHSQDFFVLLTQARALYKVHDMYSMLEKQGITKDTFLEDILATDKAQSSIHILNEEKRKAMLVFGVFFQDSDDPKCLRLLCPAAFDVLLSWHLTGTLLPDQTRESFEKFLITVIERMSPQRLRNASASWSVPYSSTPQQVSKLSVDFIQKEFYRAACTVLSPLALHKGGAVAYTIQTNAGLPTENRKDGAKKLKVEGNCDFFIDSTLRWAVELVFNGNQYAEHVDRFDARGIYAILDSKNEAVIDFRTHLNDSRPTDTRPLHQRIYWAVVFNEKFSEATIHLPHELRDDKLVPRAPQKITLKLE